MTDSHTWPSREKWEADERARAEHTIEHGINVWDYGAGELHWSDEERAEVEALAPQAIKAIRRACGRAERSLREQYPAAGELAKQDARTVEDVRRKNNAIDALDDAARETVYTLWRLQDVRSSLHAPTGTARYAAHEDLFECPTGCGWSTGPNSLADRRHRSWTGSARSTL
jgi:hypothetical protein